MQTADGKRSMSAAWRLTEDGLIVSVILEEARVVASDTSIKILLPVTADPPTMTQKLEHAMSTHPRLVARARGEVKRAMRKCSRDTYWPSRELAQRDKGSEEDIFAALGSLRLAWLHAWHWRYFGIVPLKPEWVKHASDDGLRSIVDSARAVCEAQMSNSVYRMFVLARAL